MASGFKNQISKQLTVNLQGLTAPAAKMKFVRFARTKLVEAISSGEGSKNYTVITDGVVGASEDRVRYPGGVIVYKFQWFEDVAKFAIAFLKSRWTARGPGRGGHYRDSFFVIGGENRIPVVEAKRFNEIYICNDKPYSRKAQVGVKGFALSRGMFTDCRKAIRDNFGTKLFTVKVTFIELAGGYVLKHGKKRMNRMGRMSGEVMRYPALQIRMR